MDENSNDPLDFAHILLKRQWEVFWASEDGAGADTSDWYDAKIEKYNQKSNSFTVHFIGDSESTAYEMELERSEVRPSVRAWKQRR
jgi:hypothetical protein